MTYAMGNAVAEEDTNGNEILKKRYDQKVDPVVAMMERLVWHLRDWREEFE